MSDRALSGIVIAVVALPIIMVLIWRYLRQPKPRPIFPWQVPTPRPTPAKTYSVGVPALIAALSILVGAGVSALTTEFPNAFGIVVASFVVLVLIWRYLAAKGWGPVIMAVLFWAGAALAALAGIYFLIRFIKWAWYADSIL